MKKTFKLCFAFLLPLLIACDGAKSTNTEAATDSEGTASTAAQAVDSVGLQLVASDLVAPVFLTQPPNDDRLFILDQVGEVRIVADGKLLPEPFLDIKDKIIELNKDEEEERGLLGLAFHPGYAQNGRFFVYYSAPLRGSAPDDYDHTNYVAEYSVSASNPDMADPGSEKILLADDHPYYNHNAGTLMFGPDRYLYISIGDGGNKNDIGTGHVADWYKENEGGNGQDVEKNLKGNILRIDVNSGTPYGIPADNPFVDGPGMDEIYAYGFRNPYRFSFDQKTGMLIAGDAGQVMREEINVVTKGGNYGWNVKEGTLCFNAADNKQPLPDCPDEDSLGNKFIDPVIEFNNSMTFPDGLGIVVVGGYVYRGQQYQGLNGRYLFGVWTQSHDKQDGAVFAAEITGEKGPWKYKQLHFKRGANGSLGHYLLGFGQDNSGETYLLTTNEEGPSGTTGKVYKIK